MYEWISVEDHLPEQDIKDDKKQIKVLVFINNKMGDCKRTELRKKDPRSGEWMWGVHRGGQITHWAYLPEDPSEPKRYKELNAEQMELFFRTIAKAIHHGIDEAKASVFYTDEKPMQIAANEFLNSIGYEDVYELD